MDMAVIADDVADAVDAVDAVDIALLDGLGPADVPSSGSSVTF